MEESSSMSNSMIGRRTFLGSGIAGLTILGTGYAAQNQTTPVVETTSGKILGQVINKVNTFKGVPYGTASRFMPAVKPTPWTGVRDTLEWGHEAPQGPHTEIPEVAATIPKSTTILGEDCQVLNLWTNSLSGKRPIMVWLHSDGFTNENDGYTMYDGANLARKRDVVTVTLNHRLNAFGYLYLAGLGGEKYTNSSNLGMMDIVLALQWIRDNVSKFGGDPNNVTIYNQSSNGGKVSTLLAMPAAKGLFHRAII